MAGIVAQVGVGVGVGSLALLRQGRGGGEGGGRRCRGTVAVRAEASSVALNPGIQKDSDKVVDTVVVGDLSKPLTAYCRCWRSGTFPLCDGTHAKYNKSTGDNVGPLLVKK